MKLIFFISELKVTEPPKRSVPIDTNPATRQILLNEETSIEIQKGRSGLGLSIVGGADTLLVSGTLFFNNKNDTLLMSDTQQ